MGARHSPRLCDRHPAPAGATVARPRLGPILLGILVVGAVAPWLAPHDPQAVDFLGRLQAPSASFPLGTDHMGRCVLSRLLHGLHVTPLAALVVVAVAAAVGTTIGLVAGVVGGLVDRVAMRLVDAILIFPAFAVALAVSGILGIGLWSIVIALAGVHWADYARLSRNLAIVEHQQPYVRAAEALGVGVGAIVLRRLLPAAAPQLVVLATYSLSWAILSFAGLSFLGLGAAPGTAEWGLMIAEARHHMRAHPLLIAAPGLAIVAVVLALNLLGDAVADPDTRRRSLIHRAARKGESPCA